MQEQQLTFILSDVSEMFCLLPSNTEYYFLFIQLFTIVNLKLFTMKNIYYRVDFYEVCPCCGNDSSSSSTNYKSFSEARDSMLKGEDASLTTNDPIAKYYLDDDRIIYIEE